MANNLDNIILFPFGLRELNLISSEGKKYGSKHKHISYKMLPYEDNFNDYNREFKEHILEMNCVGVVRFNIRFNKEWDLIYSGDLIVEKKKKK